MRIALLGIIAIYFFCGSVVRAATNETDNKIVREFSDSVYNQWNTNNCAQPKDNFAKQACELNQESAKSLILWHVSENNLFALYDNLLDQMKQKSQQTGRELKQEFFTDSAGGITESYWLDRGVLDSDECVWDFDKKVACDYPEDFEEFSLYMYDSNPDMKNAQTIQSLKASIDNIDENKTSIINISINNYKSSGILSTDILIEGDEYKYNEYYDWQNQTAQDIRNGKMVKVSKQEREKYKGSPFSVEWTMDTTKNWASNVVPKSIGFSREINSSDAKF